VEEYGSFVMDIFNEGSDLDLSINFSDPVEMSRQKKIEILRKFGNKLRSLQSKLIILSAFAKGFFFAISITYS
jgi:DNA polymerase sigma